MSNEQCCCSEVLRDLSCLDYKQRSLLFISFLFNDCYREVVEAQRIRLGVLRAVGYSRHVPHYKAR